MTDVFDYTILLLARNEEKLLEKGIAETIKTLEPLKVSYEIVIVENGSKDNTFQVAQAISKKIPQVKAFHLEILGYGAALKKGFSVAQGKVVVLIDVDLATDMIHLKELLEYSKDYDVVTGSRYLQKEGVKRNFDRLVLSKLFNWLLVRAFLGSKLKDNNCGFRALKKDVGLTLLGEIETNEGWSSVELMVLAQRRGYPIKEFPVRWTENYRRISSKFIMMYLRGAIKLWLRLRQDKRKVVSPYLTNLI